MKKVCILFVALVCITACTEKEKLYDSLENNMQGLEGTVVLLDVNSNREIIYNSSLAHTRTTPYSTFKIWNTLIGIENNLITSENDAFYKWDGVNRAYQAWNQDLSLQQAFKYSCVPAYQNLARQIGLSNMTFWINKLEYGDKDLSAGIDIFWLAKANKKSILISPWEQASLLKKLVNNQLPFSDKALNILKTAMLSKTHKMGSLYGKTGSGQDINGISGDHIGWYVGYIESKNGSYTFSCLLKGKEISSKQAKEMVETLFLQAGLL